MDVTVERAQEKTPEEIEKDIKAQLKRKGLEAVQQIEVRDPITNKVSIVNIDRTGHGESRLILALADPNLSREKKDHYLSMYMWELGKESMSMMVDLMRYKGEHTREGRVFQSRMRFDFETFVNSFTFYLQNQSRLLGITLGLDIEKERGEFKAWLKSEDRRGKSYSYKDYCEYKGDGDIAFKDRAHIALIEMAIYASDEAESLIKAVRNITQAREAMKGGGIYVDRSGRPYSVNDPDIMEIIKKEREIENEAKEHA